MMSSWAFHVSLWMSVKLAHSVWLSFVHGLLCSTHWSVTFLMRAIKWRIWGMMRATFFSLPTDDLSQISKFTCVSDMVSFLELSSEPNTPLSFSGTEVLHLQAYPSGRGTVSLDPWASATAEAHMFCLVANVNTYQTEVVDVPFDCASLIFKYAKCKRQSLFIGVSEWMQSGVGRADS
jgi:hypothetical protein